MDYYDKNKVSYNAIAKKYAANYESIELMEKERLEFSLLLPKGSKILDLGCGHGRDLEYFSSQYNVTGIDISSSLLSITKERVPTATLVELNIMDLDEISETYDGIWCNAVLHHLKEQDFNIAIGKIRSKLRINGIFFFSMKHNIQSHWDSKYPSHPRHYTFLKKTTVDSILSENNFEIIYSRIDQEDNTGTGQRRSWLQLLTRKL